MRPWQLVAIIATPPAIVALLGLAAICGAISYVLRDA
jgi:hypothetical protein